MLDPPFLFEAWLFAFVLWTGLALGCLGLLMIGHLLGESWLHPVRSELEAGALTLPLAALLGIPLVLGLADLYPWAAGFEGPVPERRAAYLEPGFVIARNAGYFVIWTVLAIIMTRPGEHPRVSALGLALLAPTASLAAFDWVKSREPEWWSSVFGLAFSVSQLLAGLALAILVTLLRPGEPHAEHLLGLTKALLSLAAVALWLWFAQFLIVWMGNLPEEVTWYLRRDDEWGVLNWGVILPTLALGLLLLVPPHAGQRRILLATVLLLVHHTTYLAWLLRPGAPDPELRWLDPVALVVFGLLVGALFLYGLRHRPNIPAH
jgi:hypothetical protein